MNEKSRHLSTPMGIHRLLKEPYDDREIFNSINDLIEYTNNGASYEGQRVAAWIQIEDCNTFLQKFYIKDNKPIPEFDNSELCFDSDNYILIYHNNTSKYSDSNIKSSNNKYIRKTYSINDIYYYSLLPLLNIFKYDNEYKFKVEEKDLTTHKITSSSIWEQNYHPNNMIYDSASNKLLSLEDNSEQSLQTVQFATYKNNSIDNPSKYIVYNNASHKETFIVPGSNIEKNLVINLWIQNADYCKIIQDNM